MERYPGMLMIGAADRNAGKTEFACSVIRRLSGTIPVIGVKLTSVAERDGECPRGGQGCGACVSFSGNHCVTEEHGEEPAKDTSRMLAAGAKRVFWIRVLREAIHLGASALKELLEPGTVIVCESNSLRLAVEPDLFFVVKQKASDTYKPSCLAVARYADAVIEFDGAHFSPSPDMAFSFGHWTYKRQATAIVMAGGESRRMGFDKATLPIDGEPMISRIVRQIEPSFTDLLISASTPGAFAFLDLEVVPDEVPGAGPLMALVTAVERSANEVNLVLPCDVPDLPQHLVARLLRESSQADIVVPVTEAGHLEPLFAVYRKSILGSAREAISRGERRVISFYEGQNVKRVPLDGETALWNVNTMDEYLSRLKR